MNNIFDNFVFYWSVASKYELKKDKNGITYIVRANNSDYEYYNVFRSAKQIALDAVKIGIMCLNEEDENTTADMIMKFVSKYGMLGIMTDIVITPDFTDYETTDLIKNPFIKEKHMPTVDYVQNFLPFHSLDADADAVKEGAWKFDGAFKSVIYGSNTEPISMFIERESVYGERYDWVKIVFKSIALVYLRAFYYYSDSLPCNKDKIYEDNGIVYDNQAVSYFMDFKDRPILRWNFNSLTATMRMMLDFIILTDFKIIKPCKHCRMMFIASRPNQCFCSYKCKNQHNVYKCRENKKSVTRGDI